MLRLQFSGEIRKCEHKTLGGKPMVELQICKKNYAKQGDEPSFTWIRVAVWEPKEFQHFHEGGFVAGSGEFSMRSFLNKDGVKQQSAEVRCGSFDVETPRITGVVNADRPVPTNPSPKPRVPAAAADDHNSPPF
jgi:hypothetical protein